MIDQFQTNITTYFCTESKYCRNRQVKFNFEYFLYTILKISNSNKLLMSFSQPIIIFNLLFYIDFPFYIIFKNFKSGFIIKEFSKDNSLQLKLICDSFVKNFFNFSQKKWVDVLQLFFQLLLFHYLWRIPYVLIL